MATPWQGLAPLPLALGRPVPPENPAPVTLWLLGASVSWGTRWRQPPESRDLRPHPHSGLKPPPPPRVPPAALAACTLHVLAPSTAPLPVHETGRCLPRSRRPRVWQPGWNSALPPPPAQASAPCRGRAEHRGALCSGLGPERLVSLQEGQGPGCVGAKPPFLCPQVSWPGLGPLLGTWRWGPVTGPARSWLPGRRTLCPLSGSMCHSRAAGGRGSPALHPAPAPGKPQRSALCPWPRDLLEGGLLLQPGPGRRPAPLRVHSCCRNPAGWCSLHL